MFLIVPPTTVISLDSSRSLLAPNYNLVGLRFTNNGNMWLANYDGSVGTPQMSITSATGTTTVSLCFNREYCPVVSLPLVSLVEQLIMPVQFACRMKFMIKPLPLKEAVVLTLLAVGSKFTFEC